jgi:hypothetical protein
MRPEAERQDLHDLAAVAFDEDETSELLAAIDRAAAAAFAGRSSGAALASLGYDSVLDEDWPMRLRSGRAQRVLAFETGAVTIEFEVETLLDRRALTGRLSPAQPSALDLVHAEGRAETSTDASGRFVFDDIPPGPIRLGCLPVGDAAPRIETEWVTI